MSVKAVKAKRKNGRSVGKDKRARAREELDAEALMREIENDPNAPAIARELVALRRERDKTGEPYLTIEQIMAELERD